MVTGPERVARQKRIIELAAAGDLTAAEQVAASLVVRTPGSAIWHYEAGVQFMTAASFAREDGLRPGLAGELDRLALRHFEEADRLSRPSDGVLRARIKLELGRTHEKIQGNREAAREAYEAALRLDPASKMAAAGAARTGSAVGMEKKQEGKR